MSDSNIYEFSDLENLKESVKSDLKDFNISSSRFPIRFIFLNSHDELKEVVELLKDEMSVDIIRLGNFLYSEDGWLSVDQVIDEIKKLNNTSVVVPFSEYIRFLKPEDFSKILRGLSEIENSNLKIYIPLVGLWQRFYDQFWKTFYRKDNWAPIWKLNTPNRQINVYQINFKFDDEIKINNLELVLNSTAWFNLWKKSNVNDIISFSKPLKTYFKNTLPDQTFDRKIINNPEEYLLNIFDLKLDIQYDEADDKYWNKLLIDISNMNNVNISLKEIFMDKFNIHNIDNFEEKDFLNYYLSHEADDYDKWVIKNLFLSFDKFKDSYLAYCFKLLHNIGRHVLAEKILLDIFKFEDYCESFIEERRKLLKCFNHYDFSPFEKKLNMELDEVLINKDLSFNQQFSYLTDSTKTEKYKILEIITIDNIESIIPKLKLVFSDLYYYLDWNINLNSDNFPMWVIDYLKEYNKSKLINFKSSKLEKLLVEHNHPNNIRKWHYNLRDNYDSNVGENSQEIWIDGLGAEWLSLFTCYLNEFGKKNNKKILYKTINSVYLPSATKFNEKDDSFKYEELDKFIHSKPYNYPNSLLKEIEIIKFLAKEIAFLNFPRVSIVSDHGFSCLCLSNFGNTKKYDFDNVEHEGRYFLVEDGEYLDNEDYFVYNCESIGFEDKKYVISLNHTSLTNTPIREVHGGATPEEVLVPYIVFGYDNESDIEYEISWNVDEVNISKVKEIKIDIKPEPKSFPIAIWNNERLNIYKKENKFFIQVDSLNRGKQKIIIKIDDIEIDEIELDIIKSGMEVRTYDFG